ncbi:MAG: hypothetical protein L6R38_007567 [Xanthoria sp. 2 TBL-2021]|nr:MAG: hypothetical protein L6R38_007567 [Xanthoria sp. 2 TBL-2021]
MLTTFPADVQTTDTSLRSATEPNNIVHYNYAIPGRDAIVGLDFDSQDRLDPGTVYMLLSQSLQDIAMKLHFEGDRPVPGQMYSREVIGPRDHHLHIGIWSIDEERKPDELTYKFVEDTLKGLWEYMVRRKVALQSEARLYHRSLGMVALAFVQDVDSPEEEVLARPPGAAR